VTLKFGSVEEFCNVEYGTRVVRKKVEGTIYPVYGGGGKTFHIDKTNRKDRVIISRFGMSEICTRFVSGEFFLNDSGLTVSPKVKDLSQKYLDKIILSLNDIIYNLGRGAAQKNLDVTAFRKILISFPPLKEQQKIVAKLDKGFAEINKIIVSLQHKQNQIESLKSALLVSFLNNEEK